MIVNRVDAGERLGEALEGSAARAGPNPVVLGIPRGGVVVAAVVARRLDLPLDVVIPRKLGAPANCELAIGAVTIDGTTVLDPSLMRALGVDRIYVDEEMARQREEIRRRLLLYRGEPLELDPKERVCLVVDDGLATGATAEAACRSLRARGAHRTILAVPVGSPQAVERLRGACDLVVCLDVPRDFRAVGQWYAEFEQVTDAEVLDVLRRHRVDGNAHG